MSGVPNPFSMRNYSLLAARYGEAEAGRIMRQKIRNPIERKFYEDQNRLSQHFVDRGARVKHGGSFDHNFGTPIEINPSMMALRQSAERENTRSAATQDLRRRFGVGARAAQGFVDRDNY